MYDFHIAYYTKNNNKILNSTNIRAKTTIEALTKLKTTNKNLNILYIINKTLQNNTEKQ